MMTPPDDLDVEARLRASMRTEADSLPYAPDLTAGALGRARQIRRRRRAAAGLATLGVLAVGIPFGLQVGNGSAPSGPPVASDGREPTGPRRLTLDFDALALGATPTVPWSQQATLHLNGGRVDAFAPPLDLERSAAGAVVVSASGTEAGRFAAIVTPDQEMVSVQSDNSLLDDVASSTDGGFTGATSAQLSDVGESMPGTQRIFWLVNAETEVSQTVELPGPGVATDVVAVSRDGAAVLQPLEGENPGSAVLVREGEVETLDVSRVQAWSFEAEIFARVTEVTETGSCSAVRPTADPISDLWATCEWQVEGFSPDGRWAWGVPSGSDGYGPLSIAVFDATTGEVVREVELAPQRTEAAVLDVSWEEEDRLVLEVVSDGRFALVRADVLTGDAELATEAVDYAGSSASTPPPYQVS
jgi:hypothetical protein